MTDTKTLKCSECECLLDPEDDDVSCSDCATPPKCDGCFGSISDGFCESCHYERVEASLAVALGDYPRIGVPRRGDINDQLAAFLVIFEQTCGCRHDAKRCVRCADAIYLREAFVRQLGAVRA